jgi:hypothetical protein
MCKELVSADRPVVFFGMDDLEMNNVRQWLEDEARLDTVRAVVRADMYARGVIFGLAQTGQGFSMLPGASALSHPWKDAMGTEWRWDNVTLLPVANKVLETTRDTGDFSDWCDEDFTDFVKGFVDSTTACGWETSATVPGWHGISVPCSTPVAGID